MGGCDEISAGLGERLVPREPWYPRVNQLLLLILQAQARVLRSQDLFQFCPRLQEVEPDVKERGNSLPPMIVNWAVTKTCQKTKRSSPLVDQFPSKALLSNRGQISNSLTLP